MLSNLILTCYFLKKSVDNVADSCYTINCSGSVSYTHLILESCEYCNSFLCFFPTVAVILNVEADHLDFFKDLDDITHSFRQFAELVPPTGHVIACADNAGAMDAVANLSRPCLLYTSRCV